MDSFIIKFFKLLIISFWLTDVSNFNVSSCKHMITQEFYFENPDYVIDDIVFVFSNDFNGICLNINFSMGLNGIAFVSYSYNIINEHIRIINFVAANSDKILFMYRKIKGIDMSAKFYTGQTFINFNVEISIMIFEFYFKDIHISFNCEEKLFRQINSSIFQGINQIDFFQTIYRGKYCPYIFFNSKISILSFVGFTDAFSRRNYLQFSEQ